jgi:hypothetical protein
MCFTDYPDNRPKGLARDFVVKNKATTTFSLLLYTRKGHKRIRSRIKQTANVPTPKKLDSFLKVGKGGLVEMAGPHVVDDGF